MKIGGKSKSGIVLVSNPSQTEIFAGQELQKYIQRITGAKIPVRKGTGLKKKNDIFLFSGKEADSESNGKTISRCKEDSFAIRATENQLFLLGQNARGLLYAVYTFLEDNCGVGFLAPGEENEYIPKKKAVEIKTFFRQEEPAMKLRGFSCNSPEEIDWMAKNKMNYVLGDNPELLKEARKRQMLLYFAGHSFYRWLPPQKYWESHPEYYSLLEGKRCCTYQQGAHMGQQQICVSNPDVIRIVSENIIRFIEEEPGYDFYTIWPNDAYAWCQCENCRKLDEKGVSPLLYPYLNNAGSYIYFANRVAENVSRVHPDKKLNIIAYNSTMVPPSRKECCLHPNIVLEVAFWGRPYEQPLGQPITDGEIKKKMDRAEIPPEEFALWKKCYLSYGKILKRWGEIVKEDFLIYDYMMVSQSTLGFPYPMFATVQEDHKFYHRIGVTGCYMQAHKNNCTAYGLNYWMGAKAYWGGSQNVEKRLTEYCLKRFGQGREPMKRYFQILEKSFRSQICGFSPFVVSRILRPEVIKKCQKELQTAKRLIPPGPYRNWFNQSLLHFEYSRMMRLFFDLCRETGSYVDRGNEEKAFQTLMEVYKITADLYRHLLKLKGQDIISISRLIKYSLLKQEQKWCGEVPLASVVAAEKLAADLWPKLYEPTQSW